MKRKIYQSRVFGFLACKMLVINNFIDFLFVKQENVIFDFSI
jgi:hypothetical protein